jgi:AcrR family transcriptional regulator
VLEAARKLLVEEGPDAVTALRVSEITGIARTTIYRHWPERETLLRDTLAVEDADTHVELSGDTRSDLISMLSHMADRISRRRGARFMAVAIERSGHAGRAGLPHREMFRERMKPLRRIIEHGTSSGTIAAGCDVDDAVARLAGPVFFQAVLMRRKVSSEFITAVVDAFLAESVG